MRDSKKKFKATYGYCTVCEKFYPHGEYKVAYDQVMCTKHMNEYEKNNEEAIRYFKSRQGHKYH